MHGISAETISQTLKIAVGGESVDLLHVPREKEDVNIVLQLPLASRTSPDELLALRVRSGDAMMISGDEDWQDYTVSARVRVIGAAYVSDRYDAKRYRDAYDRPTNFIGARDKLTFTSMAHQRLYADAKESDQMVVEYSVKSSPDPKAKGRMDLVRREKAILEERMDRGGTEDTLYESAKKIEFQY